MKTKQILFLPIFLLLSLTATARVLIKPTFGAEFNFTSRVVNQGSEGPFVVNSIASEEARDKLAIAISKRCKGCKLSHYENRYGVTTYHIQYADGFYFEVGTDPGVVEVQMIPSTADEVQSHLEIIQNDLFGAVSAVGLSPAGYIVGDGWAGSHIHVGLASIGEGVEALRLLRNIMVDFSNHVELAEGIFTNDSMNAPALYRLPEKEIKAFRDIIQQVDNDKIRTAQRFAKKIRDLVYDVTVQKDLEPTTKFQAFNINRIGDSAFNIQNQTFEFRAMRGQKSAEDFLLETKLLEARIQFLATKTTPVPIVIPKRRLSDQEKAELFYEYVTETGLEFKPYEKFLNSVQQILLPAIREKIETVRQCIRILF